MSNNNKDAVLQELVKQYGQLSTAYVTSGRSFCLETDKRLSYLEDRITKLTKYTTGV